jgi:predicted MFS family arabinose efflux permease
VLARAARALALTALLAGVAIAFADSAVVVLALPDLLKEYDASINTTAWVITGYNLALAIVALALLPLAARAGAARLALGGSAAFVVASLLCAVAPDVWLLIALRAVQGVAAAALLVGALPLARVLAATPGRGAALWASSGVFGAALGPALGGVLTDVFTWRAIFLAQAPVAALAVAAARRMPPAPVDMVQAEGRRRLVPAVSLGLASAALVGLLFLAVVQLVDVWRLSPLRAGIVVSVIPAAALAVRAAAAALGAAATAAGALLLAGGLAGMAFLPAGDLAWVVLALAVAGIGFGLVMPALTRDTLTGRAPAAAGALTVSIRHFGLVLGLLAVTPLLTSDLTRAARDAQLRGIATVLDAPEPASRKLRLAVDLAPVLATPARKELPAFTTLLAPEHDPALTAMGRRLDRVVQATVTRGFRRSFLLAAAFALLAAAPSVRRRSVRAAAVAVALGVALVSAELASGALAYGARPKLLPPCAERPASVGGVQGAALDVLDFVACRLHERREQLVADIAEKGASTVGWFARLLGS